MCHFSLDLGRWIKLLKPKTGPVNAWVTQPMMKVHRKSNYIRAVQPLNSFRLWATAELCCLQRRRQEVEAEVRMGGSGDPSSPGKKVVTAAENGAGNNGRWQWLERPVSGPAWGSTGNQGGNGGATQGSWVNHCVHPVGHHLNSSELRW